MQPDDENCDGAAAGDPFALQRARALAAGGFFTDLPHHVLSYLPGAGRHLVVSFDNLSALRETEDRQAWGQTFLAQQGFDILGVQIKRRDWFRSPALIAALEDLRDRGFFAGFAEVSFYGASMGGFAALAFAPLAPGARVLAFAPQRSLDPKLCPFEGRYRYAQKNTDWTLPYSDAAEGMKAAGQVYLAYDPKLVEDRAHAAAFAGPQLMRLELPWLGHKLPPALLRMGILKELSLAALKGELSPPGFHRLMRARHISVPWRVDLLARAFAKGHQDLAAKVLAGQIAQNPHWKFRALKRGFRAARAGEAP